MPLRLLRCRHSTFLVIVLLIFLSSRGFGVEKVLHTFAVGGNGLGGATPYSALGADSAGDLFGTTPVGGTYGQGVAFELIRSASGSWSERVLHHFGASGDGVGPYAGLVFDRKGNLYGTTAGGGTGADGGGIVFRLSPGSGGQWKESVLYNFEGNSSGPSFPLSGLVMDAAGNLYGDSREGGLYSAGCVYELSPTVGGTWSLSVLYNFGASTNDGSDPESPYLTLDSNGKLYGTTYHGGLYGTGTLFELSPTSGGSWSEAILYNFTAGSDGGNPNTALTLDANGSLYGGTNNPPTVFELSPVFGGTWSLTTLQSLNGTEQTMRTRFVFDKAGNLYGTTNGGGRYGDGCVFALTPAPV